MDQQARSWSHLDDLCLLLIFKKISVNDMVRSIGRVCTNWGRLQRDELERRDTLVIATVRSYEGILEEVRQYENPFGSEFIEHVHSEDGLPWTQLRPLDQIEFNTLRVPSDVLGTEAFTSNVMDTLPNITHLTLVMYVPFNSSISALQQLTRLISHYTTRLVSLKLDFETDLFPAYALLEILVPLFNSINRLESLQHLRLNITDLVISYPELSILSRLATFTSGVSYPAQSSLSSLRQYATNGNDHLRVECDTRTELEELIELDPQLASKFTRLDHVDYLFEPHYDEMQQFCQLFVSLQSLGLAYWDMSMDMLARCLSELPELVHLKLRFDINPREEDEHIARFTQVPSVRLLTLTIRTESHLHTQRLHLHQIFSNLQVLHLFHETVACDECHYTDFVMEPNIQPELQNRIGHCMHLARQPFRQCANLHTVKLDSDDEKLRSLLPQDLITRDQL